MVDKNSLKNSCSTCKQDTCPKKLTKILLQKISATIDSYN